MKFIQAAVMATAAAMSILMTTANPIPTTDTTIANTLAVKGFNATAPGTNSTTTAMFNGGNAHSKHTKHIYRLYPPGEPEGHYSNEGVVAFNTTITTPVYFWTNGETIVSVTVSFIVWAGEDGWMISQELDNEECDIKDFKYKWTGYDYEAKFTLNDKSDDSERRRQKRCIQTGLRIGLYYDDLVVDWNSQ